tara:strand:- start:159 stop:452 length:294 start_codon:yes stop_codon:yes gene_type:complete
MDITKFSYVVGILAWLLITFFYGIFELITNDGKLRDVKTIGSFLHWLISSLGGFILFVIMKYFNLEMPEEEYVYLFFLIVTLIILFAAVWKGKIKIK